MSQLSIVSSIIPAVKFLEDSAKQVRFAESRAVNKTAVDVQKFTVEKLLPSKFTLRSRGSQWYRPGTKFGFNVKFSSSKNETIESVVGSQADWLKLQEEGGIKSRVGKNIAIVAEARSAPSAPLAAKDKPRRLLQNVGDRVRGRIARTAGSGFKLKIKSTGKEGIFIRISPEKLRLMFVLQPSAKVDPVLNFVQEGTKVVNQNFEANFQSEFIKAMATAK